MEKTLLQKMNDTYWEVQELCESYEGTYLPVELFALRASIAQSLYALNKFLSITPQTDLKTTTNENCN